MDYIRTELLKPFRNHPFKRRNGAEQDRLTESIRECGTIEPLVVRPLPDGCYEVISGHRRLEAGRTLGMKELPVIVKNVSDEEAVCMMTDANLHREQLLPSEKAAALKMKLEAVKRQRRGCRHDVGSAESADCIDEKSGRQVQRYIRLNDLIPEILRLVDEGKMAVTPASELSYLPEDEQKCLLDEMGRSGCTPSHAQAIRLKKLSQSGRLSREMMADVLAELKPNQRETLRLPVEKLRQYVPYADEKQMEAYVLRACEYYRRYQIRQRERGER